MPYSLKKVKGGYKVKSPHRTFSKKPLSKKPLSKERAKKQLAAIEINTHGESVIREIERFLRENQ